MSGGAAVVSIVAAGGGIVRSIEYVKQIILVGFESVLSCRHRTFDGSVVENGRRIGR